MFAIGRRQRLTCINAGVEALHRRRRQASERPARPSTDGRKRPYGPPYDATMLCPLARDPASEALMDEPIEIAVVANRDGQAALQRQVEARVVLFRRSRH